jgi:hypothetical protein
MRHLPNTDSECTADRVLGSILCLRGAWVRRPPSDVGVSDLPTRLTRSGVRWRCTPTNIATDPLRRLMVGDLLHEVHHTLRVGALVDKVTDLHDHQIVR